VDGHEVQAPQCCHGDGEKGVACRHALENRSVSSEGPAIPYDGAV
jgi:hypothetical protein